MRKRRNRGERREKKERRKRRRSRRRRWRGEEEKGMRDYNLVHMHTTSSPMDL